MKRWITDKVRALIGTEAIVRTLTQRAEAETGRVEAVLRERTGVIEDVTIARLDHVQRALQEEIAGLRARLDAIDQMVRERPSRGELAVQLENQLRSQLAAEVVDPLAGAARSAADGAASRALDVSLERLASLGEFAEALGERARAIESALEQTAQEARDRSKTEGGASERAVERVISAERVLGAGIAELSAALAAFRASAETRSADTARTAERERQDLMLLLDRLAPVATGPKYAVETEHPVAVHSDDHRHPLGVAQDHTRSPRFVRACERALAEGGRSLRALDIGCAGGGLVLDFCLRGHEGVGIEGSDHAEVTQRGVWRLLHDRLFTADATEPYRVTRAGEPARFDVISAWEVLEHIREDKLEGFFRNVRDHLAPGGVFCASVATFECADPSTGAVYHVTIKPREWWLRLVGECGFEEAPGLFVTGDFARGSGNGPEWFDWDADRRPEMGFHLVLRAS